MTIIVTKKGYFIEQQWIICRVVPSENRQRSHLPLRKALQTVSQNFLSGSVASTLALASSAKLLWRMELHRTHVIFI